MEIEAVPPEIEAFFRRIFHRAFPAPGRVELANVGSVRGRAFRLTCVVDASHRFGIEAAGPEHPAAARSEHMSWFYTFTPTGHDRVAVALCRQLARAAGGAALPASVGEPEEGPATPHFQLRLPERTWSEKIELPGICDRGCLFCGPHFRRTTAPKAWASSRARQLAVIEASPLDEARQRMRETLARVGAKRGVVALGGEDCTRSPLFEECLDVAREHGVEGVMLQSPGTVFADREATRKLVGRGVTHVSLTAHGATPETFDAIGGKAGAHDLFWAGLDNLREEGATVAVSVPLLRQNAGEIPALLGRLAPTQIPVTVFYYYPDEEGVYPDLGDDADLPMEAFVALALRYEEADAAMAAAIDAVPPRRVGLSGIPPCALSEPVRRHYPWDYDRDDGHHTTRRFVPLAECDGCAHAARCPGAAGCYLDGLGAWSARPL